MWMRRSAGDFVRGLLLVEGAVIIIVIIIIT